MNLDTRQTVRTLVVGGRNYSCFSIPAAEALGIGPVSRLPFCLKILLENQLRYHAAGKAAAEDVSAFGKWLETCSSAREIGFRPSRVMMPDSGGLPLLGDLAAMRDAACRLGGDPARINPLVPVDFIVDHSVMVDVAATRDASARNMAIEFERNRERYAFLKWGAQAFDNLRVIPPGAGICHQINLEYLARVVWTEERDGVSWAHPDTVLGMDSHTPMINGLGIVGWGIGGLEAGSAALGEPVSILLPEVIGCRLDGEPVAGITSTDIVLNLTKRLRGVDLIGKFVEFFGAGIDALTLPDRATLSNMAAEYGATMSFFPVDAETLAYLRVTGREESHIALVEAYCRAQGLWRESADAPPQYSRVIEFDLSKIEPSVAGPKHPHEAVGLGSVPGIFAAAYPAKKDAAASTDKFRQGDVAVAAITSCTNTSNPSVMIGAGLLARNARARGLKTKPWVKTSLSPGSRAVTGYLEASGLQEDLDALGFNLTGYGCMSCMGNSGPLAPEIAQALEENDLVAAAVLSGNRNYEGRVHPSTRANFLASPPLVVAYALAGTVTRNLASDPLGEDAKGPVYLKDIWPAPEEIRKVIAATITPELFRARYADVLEGTPEWHAITGVEGTTFGWNKGSDYIRRPPFFDDMQSEPGRMRDIAGARVLALFGDMLTTDHISPIGSIHKDTPAGRYLQSLGIGPADFNSYAARRLNDEVMVRGAFANVRLRNEMLPGTDGGYTRHHPSGEVLTIFDAASRYRADGVPLVVVAGAQYGAGSSRDWAAKGPRLLGVRAVIAESFERIHRSNLIGMGVLPLQFSAGVTRKTLALDGSETFDILGIRDDWAPKSEVACRITRASGETTSVQLVARLDTAPEVDYYRHGGILHYVLRSKLRPAPGQRPVPV